MAFDYQELKGLLTYLLTYLQSIIMIVTRFALTSPAQDVDDKSTLILLVTVLECIAIICRVYCVAYVRYVVSWHDIGECL